MRLKADFFLNEDVLDVAKKLLGKVIYTKTTEGISAGVICETEAYNGVIDKACHAYNGRRTARNEIMYAPGGFSYVYLCYGIHELFNVVTSSENDPKAVLIRGVLPYENSVLWTLRRQKAGEKIGIGPGNVSRCLGITRTMNAENLALSKVIWLEDHHIKVSENTITTTPRIGVNYAGDDAELPYRILWNRNLIS